MFINNVTLLLIRFSVFVNIMIYVNLVLIIYWRLPTRVLKGKVSQVNNNSKVYIVNLENMVHWRKFANSNNKIWRSILDCQLSPRNFFLSRPLKLELNTQRHRLPFMFVLQHYHQFPLLLRPLHIFVVVFISSTTLLLILLSDLALSACVVCLGFDPSVCVC